ncbi:hypothetical protein VTO42DRAFT_1205 [Malbranchea cinnamomea]
MASSNSLTAKSKLPASSTSLKVTPSSSPNFKPATRSPYKHSPYQTSLSLQAVIGTTTSGPNGFSCHEPSRSFALCAGSAAVLAELDGELNLSQRFFRARPNATGLNPVPSYYNHGTPPSTPDTRTRSGTGRSGLNGSSYGGSPNQDWGETNQSRTWGSRDRVKAVTSVSLSPNGRFLAVGETGYNPRVLIFSTAKDVPPHSPLSIMSEHSHGVRFLAFSPNSQFLASLGDVNDGFLFVWAVNLRSGAVRLHSANKCTSFVRDMCWIGHSLVTVGTRHIKVWRLGDAAASAPCPTPVALTARNCLLGDLVDSVFTCIGGISDREAIICSETGAVCLFDDTGGQQKLHHVKSLDFGIYSVAVDFESNVVWFGGHERTFLKCSIDDLRTSIGRTPTSSSFSSRRKLKPKLPAIISMGVVCSQIVTVDAAHAIRICSLDKLDQGPIEDNAHISMPAHEDAVLGLGPLGDPNIFSADFYTWSCGGMVCFWDLQGKCQAIKKVELEQVSRDDEDKNELKILRALDDLGMFVSGDRYGVLRTIKSQDWQCANEVRAHAGEVTDIAVQPLQSSCLIASAGRDRMIQLFQCSENRFELIQTMDDHVAAVGGLLFVNDGEKLLSCSADRTVIIRERVIRESDGETIAAFIISKVLTLKASPVSMAILPDDPDELVLSTVDRQIHKFDIPSTRHIHSFRAADSEPSDAVVMGSLTVENGTAGQCPRLLIGVSATDKSIRVYDFERDVLLAREFGHTEGVSDVMILHQTTYSSLHKGQKKTLISGGLDGVIMIWRLDVEHIQPPEEAAQPSVQGEDTPSKEFTATKPPLRRILSKTELAGFQKHDSSLPSPTPGRELSPPRVRRKTSRLTLAAQVIKNNNNPSSPVPASQASRPRPSPTSIFHPNGRGRCERSISPPSPKSSGTSNTVVSKSSKGDLKHATTDPRIRLSKSGHTTANRNEFGSLNMSTEQVCRTLRAYRKKLRGSSDHLRAASELERELNLTARALSEHSKRTQSYEESSDSGKSNNSNRSVKTAAPTTTPPRRLARRMPSTPNLGQSRREKLYRPKSLDSKAAK